MNWTGFQFGDAAPYLAMGYGLFFALLGLGFVSIIWQRRALARRRAILYALKQARG